MTAMQTLPIRIYDSTRGLGSGGAIPLLQAAKNLCNDHGINAPIELLASSPGIARRILHLFAYYTNQSSTVDNYEASMLQSFSGASIPLSETLCSGNPYNLSISVVSDWFHADTPALFALTSQKDEITWQSLLRACKSLAVLWSIEEEQERTFPLINANDHLARIIEPKLAKYEVLYRPFSSSILASTWQRFAAYRQETAAMLQWLYSSSKPTALIYGATAADHPEWAMRDTFAVFACSQQRPVNFVVSSHLNSEQQQWLSDTLSQRISDCWNIRMSTPFITSISSWQQTINHTEHTSPIVWLRDTPVAVYTDFIKTKVTLFAAEGASSVRTMLGLAPELERNYCFLPCYSSRTKAHHLLTTTPMQELAEVCGSICRFPPYEEIDCNFKFTPQEINTFASTMRQCIGNQSWGELSQRNYSDVSELLLPTPSSDELSSCISQAGLYPDYSSTHFIVVIFLATLSALWIRKNTSRAEKLNLHLGHLYFGLFIVLKGYLFYQNSAEVSVITTAPSAITALFTVLYLTGAPEEPGTTTQPASRKPKEVETFYWAQAIALSVFTLSHHYKYYWDNPVCILPALGSIILKCLLFMGTVKAVNHFTNKYQHGLFSRVCGASAPVMPAAAIPGSRRPRSKSA